MSDAFRMLHLFIGEEMDSCFIRVLRPARVTTDVRILALTLGQCLY
jgi:hypothetical protein